MKGGSKALDEHFHNNQVTLKSSFLLHHLKCTDIISQATFSLDKMRKENDHQFAPTTNPRLSRWSCQHPSQPRLTSSHLKETQPTYLASEFDVQFVLFPENPLVGLSMQSSDRRVVADLLRYYTVVPIVIHQFIRLSK